ncbi:MAG: ceramidase domain-containing protein [Flavobacteriales bacterium]|nr:ceramidase domain-containing protein [Flavobacteriales bacterium]
MSDFQVSPDDPYFGMRPATCMPDDCFCEALRYGEWIRQPANTWSNLGFVAVAFLIVILVSRRKGDESNRLLLFPSISWLFAFGSLLTGVGSFFYHASFTFVGQWFDVMGMYFSITFFLVYNLDRLYDLKPKKVYLIYFAMNGLLGLALYAIPEARRYLFAACVLIMIASTFYSQWKLKTLVENKYITWAIGSFVVAYGLWLLDIKHIVCEPNSLWQLHSVWHLLGAVSAMFIFLYFLSEDVRETVSSGDVKKSPTITIG